MKVEKLLKKREVLIRLNITEYRYKQLVAERILAAPIRLSDNENSHPLHTESQLLSAEEKLYEKANPARVSRQQNRGLSKKQMKELREIFTKK